MKPPQTETEQLRGRIHRFVARLKDDFPPEKVARALMAEACDASMAQAGPMPTIWMTQRATDLMAGHWSPETVTTFIETQNR